LLLGSICVFGDFVVELFQNTRVLRAFFDNLTHGAVGSLAAFIIVNEFRDKITVTEHTVLILFCFVVASLIDVDHFIHAKSFSLKAATTLTARAFLHCSTITIGLFILFLIGTCYRSLLLNLINAMLLNAFITHHTRDASRRGFWFWPFGHTPACPYYAYILLTTLTPYALIYLLKFFRNRSDNRNKLMINV
ncbi:Transmembrane protein, partial [Pseudolycoriella hygida]